MNDERKRRLLALAICTLGLIQVVIGLLSENLFFAAYGGVYALIGAGWLRYEM